MNRGAEKFTDETVLDFGIHKGKKLANIPAGWFLWWEKQTWATRQALKDYIEENRELLEKGQ